MNRVNLGGGGAADIQTRPVEKEELERPGMSFPKSVMSLVRSTREALESRRAVSQTAIFEAGVVLFARLTPEEQVRLLDELGLRERRW